MNDSRTNTLIKFEGAGWADADTSKATDMQNCRVRTTFINDIGQKIYLEIGCVDNRKGLSSVPRYSGYEMPWHISHLFVVGDKESKIFKREHLEYPREFNKKNVLRFINEECKASFKEVETVNWEGERSGDYWDGFSHTGNEQDDFHKELT